MNIVVMGAGAIGSLFGGLLSKHNNVTLIGRKPHVDAIKKNGLKIQGKTQLKTSISAETTIDKLDFFADLLILTVKSYDTESAIKQVKPLINDKTIVLSLQNGLDNVDKIKKYIDIKNIVAGITTHGAIYTKPGCITHTGIGKTTLGELNREKTQRINNFVKMFDNAGIKTTVNNNILQEIWVKAIINSSINPITAFFQCKNGYLLENPILENLVEKICAESTLIANSTGLKLDYADMIKRTKKVISDTADNYSSMLQSIKNNKKTEIDSINGRLVDIGRKNNVNVLFNEILVYSVKSLEK